MSPSGSACVTRDVSADSRLAVLLSSHSKVRTAVLGHHVEPKRTGLSCYRIIVPRDLIKDLPHAYAQCTQETWTSMMMGQHCRVVMGPVRGVSNV